MNVHFREDAVLQATDRQAEPDRSGHILAAAERAFVRHGFRGASMQAIAAEAKMSAGNLYRYFESKEALVFGLVSRDQATIARDFDDLAQAGDLFPALAVILRRQFVDVPVERHQLIIEVWAEMTRNPALASRCGGIDGQLHDRVRSIVDAARRRGNVAPQIDPHFVVRVIWTVVAGLFKRRATDPTFEAEAELALALGVFQAAFDGILKPYSTAEAMS